MIMLQKQPLTTHLGESPISGSIEPGVYSSTKSAMSLVDSLIKQNDMFKHKQFYVQTQLTKLRSISQSLLSENIKLRQFYKERNHDISKIVNTFSIQAQLSADDYQHQQFLVRQLNCGLLKHIKLLMKEKEQSAMRIDSKREEYSQLNLQKMRYEQQVVNKMKIKLSYNLNLKNIRECQSRQKEESQSLNKLMGEVDQILATNKKICNLIYKYRLNSVNREEIMAQKEQIKTKLAFTLAQNQRYSVEIANDEQEFGRTQGEAAAKLKKHSSVKSQLLDEVAKYQQANKDHQQVTELQVTLRKAIQQSKQQRQVESTQLSQLKDSREGIAQRIASMKKGLHTTKQGHFNKQMQLQGAVQQKINVVRRTIAKNNLAGKAEIEKIKSEANNTAQLIEGCESECVSLEQQIGEYQSAVGELINPIFQIQKIEGMMRLRKK